MRQNFLVTPVVSIIAGVLILVFPDVLNIIVGVYLILFGLINLKKLS